MNDMLISKMASDMNIKRYSNEPQTLFTSRVVYSALGLWCLTLSRYQNCTVTGISKIGQTSTLDALMEEFIRMEPSLEPYLKDSSEKEKLSVKIRHLYEYTGYLQTDNDNRNHLANCGKRVSTVKYKDLYIGIPNNQSMELNGLGVYLDSSKESAHMCDFLARDNLSGEELIRSFFDICDFEERDIDPEELQFFNPLLKAAPSQSWGRKMTTDYTLARKSIIGPYYRVLRTNNSTYYAEEQHLSTEKGFYRDDFRRLYFSLRKYYENPQPMWLANVDKEYVKLTLHAKLPAREYCLLLLSSWPVGNAFSTQEYLLKRELTPTITEALQSIDIIVKEF